MKKILVHPLMLLVSLFRIIVKYVLYKQIDKRTGYAFSSGYSSTDVGMESASQGRNSFRKD